MCPICIISAIVLGSSALSAGGINWLKEKLRGQDGFGTECQIFPHESKAQDEKPVAGELAASSR